MLRVWSADTPALPWVSWASPLSPFSAPLPGIPSPPGCPWCFLFPLAWRAQHHQPVSQAPAFPCSPLASAVCPSTPTRSLSPSPSYLDAGLQTASAAAATTAAVAAAAALEGASQRAREGGRRRVSPPLRLSPPLPLLRSPPLRSAAAHTAPAHRTPPAPPGQPKGATRARPRVTQATGGGTTRASSLPLPTRISWGCPLPKPWAPPTNGHRGAWQRQGVG